ncbi:MAG: SDR family oxidoreductase [Verrucomicrobiota bacterium JB022]|nr:SDR family oxidoreductase [Verrucomicrobiota bacterium JB022]
MNERKRRKVVIGGIAGGLGRALAARLQEQGDQVAGLGRESERWEAFRSDHPDLPAFAADARDGEAWATAFRAAVDALDGVDAYVHAIGNIALKPAHLMKDDEFREVLETNLTSAFIALRAALEPMRRQKHGVIVFVSSVAAGSGLANHEAIAAAKAGIEGLVRASAATYASLGLRINAIAPGMMDTPAAGPLLASDAAQQLSARLHPLGRIGQPTEAAALIDWLIGPDAGWVTGQIWNLDGGMSSILPKPKL